MIISAKIMNHITMAMSINRSMIFNVLGFFVMFFKAISYSPSHIRLFLIFSCGSSAGHDKTSQLGKS